jgi:hypothetical protein
MSEPLNLANTSIGAATSSAGEVVTAGADINGVAAAYMAGLGVALSATLHVNFAYGSGGTTLKVITETSLDQGVTWVEVYRAAFATSSGRRVVNVSALTPKTSPLTPAALSDDQVSDGVFGDLWRTRVIVVGTYVDSTLSVRMQPHG